MIQKELVQILFSVASALSGYPLPSESQFPDLTPLSTANLSRVVCSTDPQNCAGLVALYDTDQNKVFYSDNLDLDNDTDNSFIVHELVHVLQYFAKGPAIFATCDDTLTTETEAYSVQNLYLKKQGQFARFGEALRFMDCHSGKPRPSLNRAL